MPFGRLPPVPSSSTSGNHRSDFCVCVCVVWGVDDPQHHVPSAPHRDSIVLYIHCKCPHRGFVSKMPCMLTVFFVFLNLGNFLYTFIFQILIVTLCKVSNSYLKKLKLSWSQSVRGMARSRLLLNVCAVELTMTFHKEYRLIFLKGLVDSWELVAETVEGWIICNSSIGFTCHVFEMIFEMKDPVTTEKITQILMTLIPSFIIRTCITVAENVTLLRECLKT